jgi:hypothetical protein
MCALHQTLLDDQITQNKKGEGRAGGLQEERKQGIRNAYMIYSGNMTGKDHLRYIGVHRIMLNKYYLNFSILTSPSLCNLVNV